MIKKDDVIELDINTYVSDNEKKSIYQDSIDFVNSIHYFDRQGGDILEKVNKTYRGFISEYVLQKYFNKIGHFDIKYDGLLNGKNKNKGYDEFDFKINNLTFDIKSSKELKKPGEYINKFYNIDYKNDFIDFILNERNFTLPLDQSKNKKDYIIQVIYSFDDSKLYLIGFISSDDLIEKGKVISLKVSKDKNQDTYMLKLKHGYPLTNILGIAKAIKETI